MASDDVVSRELKSLQEELSAAQRQRAERSAAAPPTQAPASPGPISGTTESHDLRDQLGELANAVTSFIEEAEKEVAAHPAHSVVGALVVGILIGRLLGRR